MRGETAAHGARDEWRAHGSVAVASMIGISLGSLHIYSTGGFIGPIESEYGWSRAQITSGMTLVTLVGALLSPFVGMAVDRIGPRRIALPGCLLFLAAFALLSQATDNIWTWWMLWLLVSLGAVSTKPMIWTSAIASLFSKGRGLALALMLCGTGLASSILPFLTTTLIALVGWRMTFPILAAIMAAIVFPILFFFFTSDADNRRRAAARSAPPPPPAAALDGVATAREAFLSIRFAKIAIAALCFTIAAIGLSVNLIPVLVSTGLARGEAAAIAGIVGVTSIFGRLTTGHLLDRMQGNIIGGLCVLLPIVTCLCILLAPGSIPVSIFAIIVMGLCLGAELDVIAFLAARHFGTARYGTIFGVISSIWSLAAGFGPLIASYVYDQTGSYMPALWGAIPLFLISSIALFTLGGYPDFAKAKPGT